MLRFWVKASLGLGLGAMVGGNGTAHAEPPLLAEDLQTQTAESPLDVALEDEVFHAPAENPIWYCPPRQYGLPPMIGDFFPGYSGGARQSTFLDRLLVVADDLDAPGTLPPGNQRLRITEPGPVGIFRTSISSVQELQALLRSGQPLPGATPVGMVNADATLTTALTINQIRALLASTPGVAFDIIPLVSPPGSYASAVDAVFETTRPGGVTRFNGGVSGALLQGGADTLNGGEDLDAFYFFDYILQVDIPTPSAGTGGVGRSRIAENGGVKPEDRIFSDLGYFDNVAFLPSGTGFKRFTPGFEKTFFDGMASLELRIPLATTVDGVIFEDGSTNTDQVQMGNLALYLKALLMQGDAWGVSGGLGLIFPTAEGVEVSFTNGGTLVDIDNDAYHLQPFLGGYYAPNERFFTQGFFQLDFDTNGNPVALNPDGTGLRDAGTLNDSTFLFLDWSIGYWLIRGDNSPVLPVSSFHEDGQITQRDFPIGLAPTVELHYARSLEDAEQVSAGPLQVGNFADDVSTLTLLVGTHLEIGQNLNIGLGYATPLSGGDDEPFDGAFRLTLNRYFGRQ
jgi:hypothetical protein